MYQQPNFPMKVWNFCLCISFIKHSIQIKQWINHNTRHTQWRHNPKQTLFGILELQLFPFSSLYPFAKIWMWMLGFSCYLHVWSGLPAKIRSNFYNIDWLPENCSQGDVQSEQPRSESGMAWASHTAARCLWTWYMRLRAAIDLLILLACTWQAGLLWPKGQQTWSVLY